MEIPLPKLAYSFQKKPLLVGGKAMEYYGLRPAGADIDLIAVKEDVENLIRLYPGRVKDLWGDLGVCPFEFEIWKSICLLTYDDFCAGAIDAGDFLVISLEKLLMMKTLFLKSEKNFRDTQLIAQKLLRIQYQRFDEVKAENLAFLRDIPGITFIEKTGPDEDPAY